MLVITGYGRSGTSFLAALAAELGFDPGGKWDSEVNAGLEAADMVLLNREIAADLKLDLRDAPLSRAGRAASAVGARLLTARPRQLIRRHLESSAAIWTSSVGKVDWRGLDGAAKRHGDQMRDIAARTPVAKDPRFMYTLPVWVLAHAPISHVLIAIRDLDEVLESAARSHRGLVGHPGRYRKPATAKNDLIYGLGLTVHFLATNGVPFSIVAYPNVLADPDELFAKFPLPDVGLEAFRQAFFRVRRDR